MTTGEVESLLERVRKADAEPVAVKVKPLEWKGPDEGIPDDLLDLIETAISDSMEMEWTPRLGAEHVYRAVEREGFVQALHTTPVVLKALIDLELYLRDTPHHNSTQAAAARAAIAQAIVRSNEHHVRLK